VEHIGDKMKITYLLEDRIPRTLQALVEEHIQKAELDYFKISYSSSDEEIQEAFDNSFAVLCAPGRYISPKLYENSRDLKLFQLWSSGYDKFDLVTPRERGIYVCNNGGANAVSVAEHTILLMLAQYKNLIDSHKRTVEGRWAGNSHGMDMFMLQGKTIGIIGLGNIGSEVAKRLNAFGCKIIVYDILEKNQKDYNFDFRQVTLSEIAKQSDIVTLHLHSNEKTKNIINSEFFSKMKSSATLINVSRAGLVDQRAFEQSLSSKSILGAGLDVYTHEPTSADDPILMHPRVIATPHMAGSTVDVYVKALNSCLQNITKIQSGLSPAHIVNGVL
jgi:D-3-phosphoglycerate dehydrogenase